MEKTIGRRTATRYASGAALAMGAALTLAAASAAAHATPCPRTKISGIALEQVDLVQAKSALVFRSGLDVMVWQADTGTATLVEHLLDPAWLSEAIGHAFNADPAFDLDQAIALVIRHELLVGTQALPGSVH